MEIVKVILGSISIISNFALIRCIQNNLCQESQWSLRYILREQNQAADRLAKQVLAEKDDLQVFESPPPIMVCAFLNMDKSKGRFSFKILLCNKLVLSYYH